MRMLIHTSKSHCHNMDGFFWHIVCMTRGVGPRDGRYFAMFRPTSIKESERCHYAVRLRAIRAEASKYANKLVEVCK